MAKAVPIAATPEEYEEEYAEEFYACPALERLVEGGQNLLRIQLEDTAVVCSTMSEPYAHPIILHLPRCSAASAAAMLARIHDQCCNINPIPLEWNYEWAELSAQWAVTTMIDEYKSMIHRHLLDAAKFPLGGIPPHCLFKDDWWEKVILAVQHNTYNSVLLNAELQQSIAGALKIWGSKLWDPVRAEALGLAWVIKIATAFCPDKRAGLPW